MSDTATKNAPDYLREARLKAGYRWLMEGLQIEQPKAHRPVTGLATI